MVEKCIRTGVGEVAKGHLGAVGGGAIKFLEHEANVKHILCVHSNPKKRIIIIKSKYKYRTVQRNKLNGRHYVRTYRHCCHCCCYFHWCDEEGVTDVNSSIPRVHLNMENCKTKNTGKLLPFEKGISIVAAAAAFVM